jgi:hypothetical protein
MFAAYFDESGMIGVRSNANVFIQLAPLAMLVAVSARVSRDAKRRGMNPPWGIAVGLVLIIFLPLYFCVRKPVLCPNCGRKTVASLALCKLIWNTPTRPGASPA